MQDAKAAANLAMTLVPRDRAQRPGPARVAEAPKQGLSERIGVAQFSRSTWRGGRLWVVVVVFTLFGWSVLLIIVFAENALLDNSSHRPPPMLVGIAVAATANGLLAIAVIALFFSCFVSILLKFCRSR